MDKNDLVKLLTLFEEFIELKIKDTTPDDEYDPGSVGYIIEIMNCKKEILKILCPEDFD